MDIITQFPKYSDGEINRALIREIRTGIELKKNLETKREQIVAEEMANLKKNEPEGFKGMKLLCTTPAWEWFNIRRVYGNEAWHDKGFIRDYQKRFKHLSHHKV